MTAIAKSKWINSEVLRSTTADWQLARVKIFYLWSAEYWKFFAKSEMLVRSKAAKGSPGFGALRVMCYSADL